MRKTRKERRHFYIIDLITTKRAFDNVLLCLFTITYNACFVPETIIVICNLKCFMILLVVRLTIVVLTVYYEFIMS